MGTLLITCKLLLKYNIQKEESWAAAAQSSGLAA